MVGIKEWAYPSTRIGDAVKFRPAALQTLYRHGCDPWAEGDTTLQDLCARCGGKTEDLMRELQALPVPDADSPWEELPAYQLIDYLTAEHRELIHTDLPALRALLEMPFGEASGSGLFRILLESFHRFTEILRAHMQEEEERIFPAILKNENALRHGGHEEGFFPAAKRVLASSALLQGEDELDAALEQWTRALGEDGGGLADRPSAAERAARAMRDLENKVRAHGRLEREFLYRIATRIEDELAATSAR